MEIDKQFYQHRMLNVFIYSYFYEYQYYIHII